MTQLKSLPRAEDALDACADASMLVASAAVSRLTLDGMSGFLDEVQTALAEIHRQVDLTYFQPNLVGWLPAAS